MGDEFGADVSYHQILNEQGIMTRSGGGSSDVPLACFDGLLAPARGSRMQGQIQPGCTLSS